ncbi:MAG: DUF1800 family protein [Bacteroidia bacterium]
MASLQQRTGVLGERLAAHILRRTTMGFTQAELTAYAGKTADQAVDDLLNFSANPGPPIDPATGATWIPGLAGSMNSSEGNRRYYTVAWWLDEVFSSTTMLQKMMLFLHQNFPNDFSIKSDDMYHQLLLLRHYAKGSYKKLAEKMCMDNGMIGFLNSQQSTKTNPNENFARELLELFTIGKGPQIAPGNYTTYTEADIREAARLFTGLQKDQTYTTNIDTDTNIFRGKITLSRHDITNKTFSTAFQTTTITGQNTTTGVLQEIADFINMVFSQMATAQNICRKLYRFFVHFNITAEVETDIITPLAQMLIRANYNLEPILKMLLKSQHFYDEDDTDSDDEIVGGMIKSPIDFYMGSFKYFEVPLPDKVLDQDRYYRLFMRSTLQIYLFRESGINLMNPNDVAGYPPFYQEPAMDDLWVNSTTLPVRYTFADMLLTGTKVITGGQLYAQIDVMAFVNNAANIPIYPGNDPLGNAGPHPGPRIATHMVDILLNALIPKPISAVRRDYFLQDLLLDNLSPINWMFEWDNYVTTGDDSTVKPQIETLIRGIIQSPEYQLT